MDFFEKIKIYFDKKYRIVVIIFFLAFLIIGLFSVKDYGISWDEGYQKELGASAGKLILNNDRAIFELNNRFHGTAFTLPLTIMQRVFHIDSIRTIFFLRHFFTFLLFYAAVIFFYLLCKNIFKDWKLGLLGSIFLVLSPRIFADSFYNPKDLPFLSLFIIGAFTLQKFIESGQNKYIFIHGLASGFAVGLRIIGVLIPILTIIFFITDSIKDKKLNNNGDIRKRTLNLFIYIFITITVFLILMPSLLPDPLKNFFAAVKHMSDYPWSGQILYMGNYIHASDVPWHYLPVYIVITTPIFYLILFFLGLAFFIGSFRKKPYLFYTENKYIIMALIWFFVPVISAITLSSTLYNGWRQLYFIYPGFLIIAIYGIKNIFNFFNENLSKKRSKLINMIVTIIIILNIFFISVIIIRQHPYEYVYHNIIAGRNLEEVKEKYTLDYWCLSCKDGLEYILKTDNRDKITYTMWRGPGEIIEYLLPEKDQERLVFVGNMNDADYLLDNYIIDDSQKKDIVKKRVYGLIVNGGEILTVYKLR